MDAQTTELLDFMRGFLPPLLAGLDEQRRTRHGLQFRVPGPHLAALLVAKGCRLESAEPGTGAAYIEASKLIGPSDVHELDLHDLTLLTGEIGDIGRPFPPPWMRANAPAPPPAVADDAPKRRERAPRERTRERDGRDRDGTRADDHAPPEPDPRQGVIPVVAGETGAAVAPTPGEA